MGSYHKIVYVALYECLGMDQNSQKNYYKYAALMKTDRNVLSW